MPRTRVPSKGSGAAAGRLWKCREVEGLTVFYSGQQSMGWDLHTAAAKSVEFSDYNGFPGLTTEHPSVKGRAWAPSFFLFPRKMVHIAVVEHAACLNPQLGGAEVALVRLKER